MFLHLFSSAGGKIEYPLRLFINQVTASAPCCGVAATCPCSCSLLRTKYIFLVYTATASYMLLFNIKQYPVGPLGHARGVWEGFGCSTPHPASFFRISFRVYIYLERSVRVIYVRRLRGNNIIVGVVRECNTTTEYVGQPGVYDYRIIWYMICIICKQVCMYFVYTHICTCCMIYSVKREERSCIFLVVEAWDSLWHGILSSLSFLFFSSVSLSSLLWIYCCCAAVVASGLRLWRVQQYMYDM